MSRVVVVAFVCVLGMGVTGTLAQNAQPSTLPTIAPVSQPAVQPTVEAPAKPSVAPAPQPNVETPAQPIVQSTAQPTDQTAAQSTAQPTAQSVVQPAAPPTTRPGNRSAEEMLKQMLQPQGQSARPLKPIPDLPPGVDATTGAGAISPMATTRPVAREGGLLLDRVGRLTRTADGKTFEITLDSDGRALIDPPMILIPNRKLMQLEDQVINSYRDLKVRVSGEITEYRGRNYLLLSRWSLVPDVTQPLR